METYNNGERPIWSYFVLSSGETRVYDSLENGMRSHVYDTEKGGVYGTRMSDWANR